MALKMIPINMVNSPNFWAPTKETYWVVVAGQAADLWGELVSVDALPLRPYVPAIGATLSVLFQRGDLGTIQPQNLSVTKMAVLEPNLRALFKVVLIAAEATNVTSGTIVFTLTEGAVVNKWSQNWSCKKLNTSPGF